MKKLKQEQIKSSNTIEELMILVGIAKNENFKFESKQAFNLFQNKFGVIDGGLHLIKDHRDYGFVLIKLSRRSHKCTACGSIIEKGSSYFYLDSFCIESKISQWKICLSCDKKHVEEHNKEILDNESFAWEIEYTYLTALYESGKILHLIGKF